MCRAVSSPVSVGETDGARPNDHGEVVHNLNEK